MEDLSLQELWIYPIKSLGGLRVPSARVFEKGLENDRRFMLIDENKYFMSQKFFPEMAQFKVAWEDGRIVVRYNNERLVVDPKDFEGDALRATIFDDVVDVVSGPGTYHQWFSDHMHLPCRIVFFPESGQRLVEPDYNPGKVNTSLSDGFPFLLISQRSLDELNARLSEPVSMRRFRPNFVIAGGEPFQEDEWKKIMIGTNRFLVSKACARCPIPNLDPDTGVAGKEPIRTLATYRRGPKSKVYFGQNVIALDHFEVTEGDIVSVQQKAPSAISQKS